MPVPQPIRRGSAEQSNSSVIFDDRQILKVFRRQRRGTNPEIEIGRYLTQVVGFDRAPALLGALEYVSESGEESAVGVVQQLVPNEGDGWSLTTEELERYYEDVAGQRPPHRPTSA